MVTLTTGVKSPNGAIIARQDIRVFLQDQYLTQLYLLGLERFQQADQTQLLSWFQISGIHGRPYIAFDGAGSGANFGGYCTHSSILFPTWHRPYLALYEQVLYKIINDIANSYTTADKAQYVGAALRFRVPYWDWASDSRLPDIIASQESVQVVAPDGSSRTLKNPLYSYTFHPIYSDFGDGLPDEKIWESWQSTLRYPTTNNASSRSQPTVLQRQLENNRLTLRDRTYNLLTQADNYEAFSNDGFLGPQSDPRFYDSLEAIHGQVHGLVGRNGHMGVVDYAAFDPVFWLHHCNVDRLFAIWQALNPTLYVTPKANDAGTFTTRRGTVENTNSPLTPFWESQNQFWTSTGVRDTRTFQYTYPELEKWSDLSPDEKRVRLRTEVNRLYGKTAPVAAISPKVFFALAQAPAAAAAAKVASPAPAAAPAPTAAAPVAAAPAPPAQKVLAKALAPVAAAAQKVVSTVQSIKPSAPSHGDEVEITGTSSTDQPGWHATKTTADDKAHYHEWVVNIRVEKYAIKTTMFIHIFLGDFNEDFRKWGEDPNLVGTHVVFGNNLEFTGCENCVHANEEHKLVTGTIPLTGALGDKLGQAQIAHLEPELVVPYLQKNLHWRLQKNDETAIDRSQVPSLKISVGHALVEVPATAADFPTWGDIHIALDVTTGRPGGAEEED